MRLPDRLNIIIVSQQKRQAKTSHSSINSFSWPIKRKPELIFLFHTQFLNMVTYP